MKTRLASLPLLIALFTSGSLGAQSPSGRDVELIICTYAEAIAANSRMMSAYNNIVKELIENPVSAFSAYAPGSTRQCLVDAGLLSLLENSSTRVESVSESEISSMLERIETMFGESIMLDFNRIAMDWTYDHYGSTHEQSLAPLMDIIRRDPSIPSAHALLGVYWHINQDYPKAIASFSAAAELLPNDHRLVFNLAQAYAANEDNSLAQESFRKTLSLRPSDPEALLSLAAIEIKAGNMNAANELLSQISSEANGFLRLQGVKNYMAAMAAFKQSDFELARDQVIYANENLEPTPGGFDGQFHRMMAALLESIAGTSGPRMDLWHASNNYPFQFPDPLDGNDPITRVWYDLWSSCGLESVPAQWANAGGCLPMELHNRIDYSFDLLIPYVFDRLYFRNIAFAAGRACPFLYSLHKSTGEWLFESTIITGYSGRENEAEQRLQLNYFNGTLQLRELEREISYIDKLVIEAVDYRGKTTTFYSNEKLSSLNEVDGEKLVLNHGEGVVIEFDEYDSSMPYSEIYVVATGYYDPL
ncbi:MAG: tetratricopeptide repeat protein [Pseudohongiellaceae bacterium]